MEAKLRREKTMKKITLLLSCILATYVALDSCPARAVCPELAAAEADILVAQEVVRACMDPDECRLADQYLDSAIDRLASARVVCEVPSDASPFDDSAPLMDGVADYDGDDAAYRAVMGDEQ
jgi:hypothetical protein